ncbi:hypothetical protein D8770_26575 [Methylobacterium sp. DB1607]|nr:hypothetical protein [Methylobacterium sp. DB1607]
MISITRCGCGKLAALVNIVVLWRPAFFFDLTKTLDSNVPYSASRDHFCGLVLLEPLFPLPLKLIFAQSKAASTIGPQQSDSVGRVGRALAFRDCFTKSYQSIRQFDPVLSINIGITLGVIDKSPGCTHDPHYSFSP